MRIRVAPDTDMNECSPLAIAWYLVRSGRHATLDYAYDHVCAAHPQTERRVAWAKG